MKSKKLFFILVLLITGLFIVGTTNAQSIDSLDADILGFDIPDNEFDEDENDTRDTKKLEEKPVKKKYEPPPFRIPYDPYIPAKRVLVSSFDIAVAGIPSGLNIEKGLRAQLITTLSKSKNFIIVDRETISDLQNELILAQSGAVTKKTAVKAGRLLGAQVIIKGVVTEFSEAAEGKSSGFKFNLGTMAGIAGAFTDSKELDLVEAINPEIGKGNETVTGKVGLDVRLIGVETGMVIKSIVARGEITKQKSSRVFGIAGFSTISKGFENTVIGRAIRMAIEDAVWKIFDGMKDITWKGRVAAVKQGRTVIINAGSNKNIRPGQLMYIESEIEKITDPETGLVLYADIEQIGVIRIMSVKENVSFAEILSGENIKRGDIVTMKYD
ncbi:MAG: CsgG/HfaB family protein [Candidatus Scalinduaceae bacterium]